MNSESERLRQAELEITEVLTMLRYICATLDEVNATLRALTTGDKLLPQCKDNERRLGKLERDASHCKSRVRKTIVAAITGAAAGLASVITAMAKYIAGLE
ncbi:MAG: hypothetical protein LIP23_10370 [Planctomycetes bacterium]|nr:hypothetical protein [Planctomycetota bacterium]